MNEQSSIQQGANISSTPETDTGTQGITDGNATSKTLPESTEIAATEHRQSYGTAKTENLRDSGLWRILLPGFILLCCFIVLAVPLIILELGVAAVIIRYFFKTFLSSTAGYSKS